MASYPLPSIPNRLATGRFSTVKKLFLSLCSAALITAAAISTHALAPQDNSATQAKIAALLEKSGYKFAKVDSNVWTIPFNGKAMGEFRLFVTSTSDLVLIGAVVAEKDSLRLTADAMRTLLQKAHELDRVKVGIDNDGDVFVRAEVSARVFDLVELKAVTEQVAAAADEVRAAIKPYFK
jgi:hypothetical protein